MGHVDVAGVRYELPDGRVLLDEVSFRVGEGAKVALVGANGAGKSSTLNALVGLLKRHAPITASTTATASHLVVRVKPAVPMRYESHGWDFGWLYLRTDG